MDESELAYSTNTPPKVLERLANDVNWCFRCRVARTPNTKLELLEKLSNDKKWVVRKYVAENPIIPKYIKTYLRYKNYLKCYGQT